MFYTAQLMIDAMLATHASSEEAAEVRQELKGLSLGPRPSRFGDRLPSLRGFAARISRQR